MPVLWCHGMIYIQKLELEDFQTHKKTSIELSPNFNVIVGCTRSGKSSVVRALDFLFYNNWYEDYQRFDSHHTTITATLSNGKVLVRTKNDRINKIDITSGAVTERFESFGLTLPAEATKAIGIIPVEITSKDTIQANVANQDDPLFLLYSTGTDRTKILSRLSGLHWLDYALKDLNKDRRTKSGEIQLLQETNEQLLVKVKTFKDLPEFRKELVVVREKVEQLKSHTTLLHESLTLQEKTRRWKVAQQELQKLKTINFSVEIPSLEKLIRLKELAESFQDKQNRLNSIENNTTVLQRHYQSLTTSIQSIEKQIAEVPTCAACGQEATTQEVTTST